MSSKWHCRTGFSATLAHKQCRRWVQKQAWDVSRLFCTMKKVVVEQVGNDVWWRRSRCSARNWVYSAAGSGRWCLNWPWHQAGCYQGFARRNQQRFWELFVSTRREVPVKALCWVLLSGAEYWARWTVYIQHFLWSTDLENPNPDWKGHQYILRSTQKFKFL